MYERLYSLIISHPKLLEQLNNPIILQAWANNITDFIRIYFFDDPTVPNAYIYKWINDNPLIAAIVAPVALYTILSFTTDYISQLNTWADELIASTNFNPVLVDKATLNYNHVDPTTIVET